MIGFVYIWYDTRKKKRYIGSHWGTEDDGYVCSSPWMKRAHKKRPQDFKRRIVARVYSNRQDLLDEEHRWILKIKPEEFGNRYYNHRRSATRCWFHDGIRANVVRGRIARATKEAMADPAIRAKISKRTKESFTIEVRKKMSDAKKKWLSIPENYKKHIEKMRKYHADPAARERCVVTAKEAAKLRKINIMYNLYWNLA